MFAGIVETACPVLACAEADGLRLTLDLSPLRRLEPCDGPLVGPGDSVAVNGVCLTVAAVEADRASFDVVPETLRCTALSALRAGGAVNVERALRFGERVDGHLVQGHVEQTGSVLSARAEGGDVRLQVACGPALARRLLPKGSVAVDGVSLTVAALDEDRFEVALVPHTLERTTLGQRQPGDQVNLEPDMIGQWVRQAVRDLLPGGGEAPLSGGR